MLRRDFLGLASVSLVGFFSAHCSRDARLKKLTVDEVATRLAAHDGRTFAFDANGMDRFRKGHLPGAKWVQYDNVTAADLPADKTATLVFYCANEMCHACHSAAILAEKLGFSDVYIMPEGIAGWESAGKPVEA
jgi:rhodanese-related sulfurtransferase